jgi:hypothetical protein
LDVDFFQLYVDIMQKLLNTQLFAPYPPLQRILSNVKSTLLAGLLLVLLVGFTNQARADVGFTSSISISGTGTNGNYAVKNNTNGLVTALGSYDRGSGHLYVSGVTVNTTESKGDNVTATRFLYRVYPAGSQGGNFNSLELTTANPKDANKSWTKPTTTIIPDLLSSTSEGDYVVEFWFQASSRKGNSTTFAADDRSGQYYRITFNVKGKPAIKWSATTTSNDWFERTNWEGGVLPDTQTDVTIPYPSSTYPTISDPNRSAYVRTLTIEGNPKGGMGATLTQLYGDLYVYGDFKDVNSGFRQQGNSTLVLAGSTTQNFDGGLFNNVKIQGGGDKNLSLGQRLQITTLLQFVSGKIVTPVNSNSAGVDLGAGGKIIGETENNYVQGYLQASGRNLSIGTTYDFGGIGVDLTVNSNSAATSSQVIVTRQTGSAYAGVGISPNKASITRAFTFTFPDAGSQSFGLTFHYLNAELNNNTASKLGIYSYTVADGSSTNYGSNYTDVGLKTVTANNISGRLATTFTLAESITPAPLPVELVSFTATATPQGAALLRWVTAKELNNKGFGIERTLGTDDTWKEVGYVATTNTPNGKSYEYTDKSLITAPASTQAYYRLRQEDIDGKISYSPVAVVARQAVVANTDLVLSPVPVDGPSLSVSFAEAGQAGQEVAIINTQGQRMLHFTTQGSADGTLNLPVANLAAGVYIVRIQTPGQAVRHARFVKL